MSLTLNGNGTVTGLAVGGLPDGSINNADLAANAVSTSKILNGAVTLAKMGSDEQAGLAKAWVNFNGTGTVAIRASYNVSSITDNGTGDYTVNFTNAMADANYAWAGSSQQTGSAINTWLVGDPNGVVPTTSALRIKVAQANFTNVDTTYVDVAIFR